VGAKNMADSYSKASGKELKELKARYRELFASVQGERSKGFVAKYLGVSVGSINAYLRGDRAMSPKVAIRVGLMLDVNPELLSPALKRKMDAERAIAGAEARREESRKAVK